MNKPKTKKVPNGYQMVSFDVKSLFTKVPLDRTIQLMNLLSFWKRYADATIHFVKTGTINYIIMLLNNFDPTITFSYEIEDGINLFWMCFY